MDLYKAMGNDLRDCFKHLFDPKHSQTTRQKMAQILAKARSIGGLIEKEALQLNEEINHFLKNPHDQKWVHRLKEHALRLEQETREI